MEKFFSPGKLLITAEYFVLDGAKALAVPTKMGQDLVVEKLENTGSTLYWKAWQNGEFWLDTEICLRNFAVKSANNWEAAAFLANIVKVIQKKSTSVFQDERSYNISTHLDFPSNFGLGSSSTLINNLASWSEIDPFELNLEIFGGSGYDIAVAKEQKAIIYQNKPKILIEPVNFDPPFKDELYFVHLNAKQNSRKGIQQYRSKEKLPTLIIEFSELTDQFLSAKKLSEFAKLMAIHEEKVSKFLDIPTVKSVHFPDYNGSVKSLGAWGGDFVMATATDDTENYFKEKGFATVFRYTDLISE